MQFGTEPGKTVDTEVQQLPVVAVGESVAAATQDTAALMRWARVGMTVNNMLGVKGADGVTVLKAKLQYAKDSTDSLWIFEGRKGKVDVVSYARDKSAAAGIFRWNARRGVSKIKWKVDEGYQGRANGSDGPEEELGPAPAL